MLLNSQTNPRKNANFYLYGWNNENNYNKFDSNVKIKYFINFINFH